jgi:hypothetical protein
MGESARRSTVTASLLVSIACSLSSSSSSSSSISSSITSSTVTTSLLGLLAILATDGLVLESLGLVELLLTTGKDELTTAVSAVESLIIEARGATFTILSGMLIVIVVLLGTVLFGAASLAGLLDSYLGLLLVIAS